MLQAQPPGGPTRWTRRNFRGREVDLYAAPAAAAGLLVTALGTARAGGRGLPIVTATTTGLGLYDDLAGGAHARGLRGHFAALRRGEITTGFVKMAGMFAAGFVGATRERAEHGPAGFATALLDAAVVSGTANLINLLDLRPGRATKAALLILAPLTLRDDAAGVAAAGAAATALCLLPGDLGEQHMLGDCGANGLGAVAGWCVVARSSAGGRAAALAGIVGLTLLSERVSFSKVIDNNRALAAIDRLGRGPE